MGAEPFTASQILFLSFKIIDTVECDTSDHVQPHSLSFLLRCLITAIFVLRSMAFRSFLALAGLGVDQDSFLMVYVCGGGGGGRVLKKNFQDKRQKQTWRKCAVQAFF